MPRGWHVPSDSEWKQLEMYLGMNQTEADTTDWRGTDEGGKLKEADILHWDSPNTGATNESGFTALPNGMRDMDASFRNIGLIGGLWSSTVKDISTVWMRRIGYNSANISRNPSNWYVGYSVRCVKDDGSSSQPTVSINPISQITESSAQSGGEVTSDGGATVTARGVCWSTSQNPTLSDDFTTDGSGTGPFTSSITDLECNTTYYVRAYATNSNGTSYGNQVSLITSNCLGELPTVATALYIFTESSAQVGGNVSSMEELL